MSTATINLMGVPLKSRYYMRFALTKIFGIGHETAHRICARFMFHDTFRVRDLSTYQITALTSFLSSPSTATRLKPNPLASFGFDPHPPETSLSQLQTELAGSEVAAARKREAKVERRTKLGYQVSELKEQEDVLHTLKIQGELKREVRENIALQRMIGSYRGKRHAMRLPVRGQSSQSNARTARKLNRVAVVQQY